MSSFSSVTLFLSLIGMLFCNSFFSQFEIIEFEQAEATIDDIWGTGVSLIDFDRDGWDDITLAERGVGINAFRNLGDSTYVLYYHFPTGDKPKAVTWVDFDNDGDYDLFHTCDFCNNQLYRNNGDSTFTNISETAGFYDFPVTVSMGTSWGDYDRDGDLDVYICNYASNEDEPTNWLFRNNGDETFSEIASQLGIEDERHASLQVIWADLNLDGWQDVYVTNDRDGPNACYYNQQGTFLDVAAGVGLAMELDAMSNSISDLDRDGDFDIYITNTYDGNLLMECSNGIFNDVAPLRNCASFEWSWSGLWIDYDLDGDDDLHVATRSLPVFATQNPFYINQNGQFELLNNSGILGDDFESYCASKGDLNNDGKPDFVVNNQRPASTNIYMNTLDTAGHWVKIELTGTVSNKDAIGTIVRCYHGGHLNMFQKYCGENYLGQDSQYEIIGLGADSLIDSLVITWPGCFVERYYNLPCGLTLNFIEGATFQTEITAENEGMICPQNDEIALTIDQIGDIVWNTGDTTQTIAVTTPGLYSVLVTNDFGITDTAFYQVESLGFADISLMIFEPLCASESSGEVVVNGVNESHFMSLNGEQITSSASGLNAGDYELLVIDTNGCHETFLFTIWSPTPLTLEIFADTILCFGGTTSLSAVAGGGVGPYELNWSVVDTTAVYPGVYSCMVTDLHNCTQETSIEILQPDPLQVVVYADIACFNESVPAQVSVTGGTPDYIIDWNGEDSSNLEAGAYSIEVTDVNNCTIEVPFEILEYSEISYTASIIEPNNGPNGQIEIIPFGGLPPYSFEWQSNSTFNPLYNLAQGEYTCVITDAAGCQTTTETFSLIDSEVPDFRNDPLLTYPNPFSNELVISNAAGSLKILDSMGREILHAIKTGRVVIDTTSWASGVYFLQSGNKIIKIIRL